MQVFTTGRAMVSERRWARPAFRFAMWLALGYLVVGGGGVAIAKFFTRVIPCRPAQGIELTCPVMGVDVYNAYLYAGIVGHVGLFALPVVLVAIVVALCVGIRQHDPARRKARAAGTADDKP